MYARIRKVNQPEVLGPKYRQGWQMPRTGGDKRCSCAATAAVILIPTRVSTPS